MTVRKYKYYFKKPKSEITKDILLWLFAVGAVVLASSSAPMISQLLFKRKSLQRYPKQRVSNMFSFLRKRDLLKIEKRNHQIYISLSNEGKRRAGIFQLHELKIPRPKRWDGKWRLLLFDISEKKKIRREALRGMLKQLGFYPFQKSVWVHAFDCKAEAELLKDFFGLDNNEIRLITTEDLGEDSQARKVFGLYN